MNKLLQRGFKRRGEERLFTRACNDSTRGNVLRHKKGRFRLDTRRKCFNMRVVRDWKRLPREVGDSLFLEVFWTRVHGALNILV